MPDNIENPEVTVEDAAGRVVIWTDGPGPGWAFTPDLARRLAASIKAHADAIDGGCD